MLNKACILGRIGKKDYKQIKNGSYMTTLSIATSRKFMDSQGNKREDTTWHTVNFFNKVADIAHKYAHVGDIIYVEGEISHREIETKDGIKKWVYSVVGNELKLLPQSRKKDKEEAPGNSMELPESLPITDDEIPF